MSDRCQVCGSTVLTALFKALDADNQGRPYHMLRCGQCGVAFPDPMPDGEILYRAYQHDYYGNASAKFASPVEHWTRLAARRRARSLTGGQQKLRVLDVGCGRGLLVDALRRDGHDALGVERSGSPFASHPHVRIGDLAQMDFEPDSLDLIVVWHVLEHLPDPSLAVERFARWLAADGELVIAVPNFGSLQRHLFGARWFHLDLPRHLFHFDRGSLEHVLHNHGFEVAKASTWALDQNLYGFVQSALNSIPGLPMNHLYGLLRSGRALKHGLALVGYAVLLAPLAVAASIESLYAVARGRGATLILKARRRSD